MKLVYSLLTLALLSFSFVTAPQGYAPGDKARDFSLKNIDGKMVSLADYQDAKGYIVVFTCNHCPYSKLYEDRIIELHNMYASKGYPVVAINPNDATIQPQDSFEKMQERAEEKGFPFAYLYDDTQEIARAYGATNTPHVFILQKEKKDLVVKYIGAIDNNAQKAENADKHYVQDAIQSLMDGKAIEKNSAKAVGCTIKWSKA